MKKRAPPKYSCLMEEDLDILSNLPAHLIDNILTKVSIRDAVRMSVLSSKWRYKWMTIPDIVFDSLCVSTLSPQDLPLVKSKLVNIVDCVLLLHTGPICKFKLSHKHLLGVSDIDRWVLYVSRKSVKELVLEIWKGDRYKLPSSVYSCQNLIHLELFNCLLKPPPRFNGFRCLKSLDIQHITIAQDVFEYLISRCLLLERLTLMNFDGFSNINIHAPNLKFFDIGGVFDDVSFKNTSDLAVVSIALYVNARNDHWVHGKSSNLVMFLEHLPRIERLEVQSHFLKYLADGNVPEKLPKPCNDLSYLQLRINFNNREENFAAFCLLKCSPNLQELEMLTRPEDQGAALKLTKFWEDEHNRDCIFTRLRKVKIVGISGIKSEVDFIHFLLAKSPALERMTVKPASLDRGWDLLKELLRFRRASVLAEIIFLDP